MLVETPSDDLTGCVVSVCLVDIIGDVLMFILCPNFVVFFSWNVVPRSLIVVKIGICVDDILSGLDPISISFVDTLNSVLDVGTVLYLLGVESCVISCS